MEEPSSSPPRSTGDGDSNYSPEFSTREEVIERRSRRLKRLAKVYRDHYWSLMEDLKLKHREYYWKYGKSSFKEEDEEEGDDEARANGFVTERSVNNNNNHSSNRDNCGAGKLGLGLGFGESFRRCAVFPGCSLKAMALTNFCHKHILYDKNQKLYKGCKYISHLKSRCGKPILFSTIPSLCPIHLPMAEKNFKQALKKGGVSVASSTKLGSKFHLVITEYVHLIQTRRRATGLRDKLAIKDNAS